MDSAEIGKGVLIGTLATVVGGIILKYLGYLPAVGHWIVAAFVWVWHALVFPVPVPLVVLLIVVGIVAYSLRGRYTTKEGTASISLSAQLSADEEAVIRLLAGLDGQWAGLSNIAERISRPYLITQRAVASLLDRGFIASRSGSAFSPQTFGLDAGGVEYAVSVGYLR